MKLLILTQQPLTDQAVSDALDTLGWSSDARVTVISDRVHHLTHPAVGRQLVFSPRFAKGRRLQFARAARQSSAVRDEVQDADVVCAADTSANTAAWLLKDVNQDAVVVTNLRVARVLLDAVNRG